MCGGELILPVGPDADGDRRLSLQALSEILGVQPVQVIDNQATFRPSDPPEPPPSVLTWALTDFPAVVHAFMLARTLRQSTDVLMLDDVIFELLASGAEMVATARRQLAGGGFSGGESWFEAPEDAPQIGYSEEYGTVARIIAWHLLAAGRRASLVRAVLDAHEIAGPGPVVDLGGRYGLLGAELALDPCIGADPTVVCDSSTAFLASALAIYRAHRRDLHGRYLFSLHGPAEYVFENGHGIVGLFGSLLDVDPSQRPSLLMRCQAALRDGGLLIVEQPLDASSSMTDVELDQMMRPLGRLRVFAPHTFAELDCTRTQAGSVRVVSS